MAKRQSKTGKMGKKNLKLSEGVGPILTHPPCETAGDMEKKIPCFTMSEVAALTKDELAWATQDSTPATPEDDRYTVGFMVLIRGQFHDLDERLTPKINFSKSGKILR